MNDYERLTSGSLLRLFLPTPPPTPFPFFSPGERENVNLCGREGGSERVEGWCGGAGRKGREFGEERRKEALRLREEYRVDRKEESVLHEIRG